MSCETTKCPMFNEDLAKQMLTELTEIRTRVHIYLGNGKDGLVPEKLKVIEAEVAKHETYIVGQKGAASRKGSDCAANKDKWTLRIAVFSSVVALIGTLVAIAMRVWGK